MDQQVSTGSESGARLEPIGESWAPDVGPVRLGTSSGRLRWAVAMGIVLIVSLMTLGGAFVLSGAGGAAKSLTAGSAPKESVVFVDLRTDLPGDQYQKLADFMSHFPGFKDRTQFDGAIDDILNRLTSEISPDLTYTSALKAWTTGEVSIAITNLGSPGSSNGVVIVALTDRAAGERWVSSEVSRTGLTFKAEDYAGAKIYVAQPGESGSTSGSAAVSAAYAFTDKVLLLGTVDAVKAGIDAPSKGSLAGNSNYQAAMKSLSGDSIATFYADPQALVQQAAAWAALGGTGLTGMMGVTSLPAWLAGSVRAESDHMSVEITMPKTAGAPSSANAESVLASQLPGSTVGVMEVHAVGKLVDDGLKAISGSGSSTADEGTLKTIQDALTRVGGIDWLGDADMVLTKTGSTYGGGIVVKTPDAGTAISKKATLTNLVALAGSLTNIGSGFTSTDETYKGTTITLITVPNGSGSPLEFSIATKNDLIVAGYGDAFVKAVLDTTAGTSLADSANYKSAIAAVGPSNAAYGYFDISAVADQIGQTFSGNASYYNLNYKPYVDHIGGAAFAEIDGSTVILRLVVTAK